MFNYDLYNRQLQKSKTVEKIKKDYVDDRQRRIENNRKLTQNYRKRVENFIINMIENPIPVVDYKSPLQQSKREDTSDKLLADGQIYVKGFKHEKDRIAEATEKNKDLDFLPNQVTAMYQFRTRDPSKEIQPEMRFKDKTSLERIQQFLKDHTQTQVENMNFDKNKNIFKLDSLSNTMNIMEKRAFAAKHIAKNLLPSLHHKTHFQAAQTLYNNLPVSLCEDQRMQSVQKLSHQSNDNFDMADIEPKQLNNLKLKRKGDPTEITREDMSEGLKEKQFKSRSDQLETFNSVETTKQILDSCNILRKKNPKVKQIHPGEGHLMSTLDRSISEMYLSIYNIDLAKRTKKKN